MLTELAKKKESRLIRKKKRWGWECSSLVGRLPAPKEALGCKTGDLLCLKSCFAFLFYYF